MFKKRKAAQKQERDQSRAAIAAAIGKKIEKAGYITDPAAQILKLDEIRREIRAKIEEEKEFVAQKADKAELRTVWGGVGASMVPIAVGGVALATGGLALAALYPIGILGGGLGSGLAAAKRKTSVKKKFNEEVKGHVAALTRLDARATETMLETVRDKAAEISQSPLCPSVLCIPSLTDPFFAALARAKQGPRAFPPMGKEAIRADERKPNTFPGLN
jgi:hypothetical protein